MLVFLVLVLFSMGATLLAYASVARGLPPPDQLLAQASQSQTRIYDRNGQLLQAPLAPNDPSAGLRRRVTLDEISPHLVAATIATEDANFYTHRGVDPLALSRAVYQAIRTRGPVVGTSTISQQLVKLVFLSPERTVSRKVKEAILAAEITRRYDKDTILEFYLNELYYGNLAYGAEAAAELYFDKPASQLTLGEASLLAGLPQAPATYDPLQNPDAAKARQADVLRLMVQHGAITPAEADAAWLEPLSYYGHGLEATRLENAPHFVMFVRSQMEQLYGPEVLYRGGLQVYTTLDLELQHEAEDAVTAGVERLQNQNVSNGSLVALRPATGEVLTMVGSADFYNPEISGQVNVALAPRQPGSAIKPFTYLASFERQDDWWTAATLIDDVRTEFDDGPGRPPYVPVNYDGREHGRVSVRTALANSYNIPAVKALEHVGVDALLLVTDRFGIQTLTEPGHPAYGLSLTLGGGEVTLLELTGAYAALANGGQRVAPATVLCVLNAEGQVLERLEVAGLPQACQQADLAPDAFVQQPSEQQATSPQHAYLITDILQDNEARTPTFGANSALRLDRPAAAKTGTTNDVRDGWTIGYTPGLVTGVWVGNSSGSPMNQSLSGSQVAAPIWNRFMRVALEGVAPRDFPVPDGMQTVEVCTLTGAVPDSTCPPDRRRVEVFAPGQLPPGADTSRYQVAIREPVDGQTVEGVVRVMGSATVPDFDHYLVEYGESYEPGAWGLVAGPIYESVEDGELALWDLRPLPKDGPHVLRVVAVDRQGRRIESAPVRVNVLKATPTPAATATATPALTPTPTATLWITATATSTATPSPLPTAISETVMPLPATSTATAAAPTATWTPVLPTATVPGPEPTATQPPPEPTATLSAATATPLPTATPPVPPGLVAQIDSPQSGQAVQGLVSISGAAGGPVFASYRLELGQDNTWQPLIPDEPVVTTSRIGELGIWNSRLVANGAYTVRLTVFGTGGEAASSSVDLIVAN